MHTYSQSFRGIFLFKEKAHFSDVCSSLERQKNHRFKAILKQAKRWPISSDIILINRTMIASEKNWNLWLEALKKIAEKASDGYFSAIRSLVDHDELVVIDAKKHRKAETTSAGQQLRFFPLYEGCIWRFNARRGRVVQDVDWRVIDNKGERHLTSHCGFMPSELRALLPNGSKLYHRWGKTDRLILDEKAPPGSVWLHCDPNKEIIWLFFHDGFEAAHTSYADLHCALKWRIERHHIRRKLPNNRRLEKDAFSSLSRTKIMLGDQIGPALIHGTMKMDLTRIEPGKMQVLPRISFPKEEKLRPWWKFW